MKTNFFRSFIKSIIIGSGFGIGLATTIAIGITVSTTFTSGDALTANKMNALKSVIESIPDWKKDSTGDGATILGNVGIGTATPTALLDISSDAIRIRSSYRPPNAGDACNPGKITWDAGYIYVCTASGVWKGASLNNTPWAQEVVIGGQ